MKDEKDIQVLKKDGNKLIIWGSKTLSTCASAPGVYNAVEAFHKHEEEHLRKQHIIEKHGMKDGKDDDRYEVSFQMSQILDIDVELAFIGLINLESQSLICLTDIEDDEREMVGVYQENMNEFIKSRMKKRKRR